jgi:hypothetical protein
MAATINRNPSLSSVAGILALTLAMMLGTRAMAAPIVTNVSPGKGRVGTEVRILGSGFGNSQGSSTVTFSGSIGNPRYWSETEIVVPVPEGATTGPLVVTVDHVRSKAMRFVVLLEVNSVIPPEGCIGTIVTLDGSGFGSSQGLSTVTFNGVLATPVSWSAIQILVPVPTGATTGPLVISVRKQSTSGINFIVACP